MAAPRSTFISDLLEEHLEELSFLWGQRLNALYSPVLTSREVRELEERIEAHIEGLLAAEEGAVAFLLPRLKGTPTHEAFAAAFALLRLEQTTVNQQVWAAFVQSEGETLAGLTQALCMACPAELKPRLIDTASAAPSPLATAALEVLAFASPRDIRLDKVVAFLKAEDPALRAAGWRVVAFGELAVSRDLFDKALLDANSATRRAALEAAAWTKQPWLLDYCRNFAVKNPPVDTLPFRLLAVLGQATDLQRMIYLGKDAALRSQRFEWLGAYGHPGTIELILEGLCSKNLREVIAAGHAFTQITGCDIASSQRVTLPPEDGKEPDAFEKEFLDEAKLPDAARAHAHWTELKDVYVQGTRWCCGQDLTQIEAVRDLVPFAFASRASIYLRAKQANHWHGTRADLGRYPVIADLLPAPTPRT